MAKGGGKGSGGGVGEGGVEKNEKETGAWKISNFINEEMRKKTRKIKKKYLNEFIVDSVGWWSSQITMMMAMRMTIMMMIQEIR